MADKKASGIKRKLERDDSRGMTTQGGDNLGLANEGRESIRGERAGRAEGHTLDAGAYAREGKVKGRMLNEEHPRRHGETETR